MLFSRLSHHIRTQNWTALLLEFFVVVVGVFLAIQIEQIYSDRQLRAEERQHLISLKSDFESTRDELVRIRARYIANRDSAIRLLEATDSDSTEITYSEFYTDLSELVRFGRFASIRTTWNVLTAGGEISTIRNSKLKSEISKFFAEEEIVIENYNAISGMWDSLDRFAMANYDYVEIVRAFHPEDLMSVQTRESQVSVEEILKNPEFRDWLGYQWHFYRDFVVRFDSLLKRTSFVLAEIDQELGRSTTE